jgi:hypothetical protein
MNRIALGILVGAFLVTSGRAFALDVKNLKCTEGRVENDPVAQCKAGLQVRNIEPIFNVEKVCHGIRSDTNEGALLIVSRDNSGQPVEQWYFSSAPLGNIASKGSTSWGERAYKNDKGDFLIVEEAGNSDQAVTYVSGRKLGVGTLFWARLGK